MDILDILYTPVDIPPAPDFDRVKLNEWCQTNREQVVEKRGDGKEITAENIYPWHIVYARHNFVWFGGFKEKFPELADYLCAAYMLKENELASIVLLPVKPNYTGAKYWHADPDEIGLRLYLENDDYDRDFLLIKPSVNRNNSRGELGEIPENGVSPKIQDVIHSARILKSNQAFYINNVRAIHTVNVNQPNSTRLAVLIIPGRSASTVPQRTKDLIIKSAEKFSDLSIKWTHD
jgi:hypothetical protein